MKRLLSLLVLVCFLLCGCGSIGEVVENVGSNIGQLIGGDKLLTAADSVVKLGIYPDGCEHTQTVGGYLFRELNAEQQSVYIKIDNAVFNMQTGFIDVGKCSRRDLELVYQCIRRDRPEYFWLPNTYYLQSFGGKMSIKFADSESDWFCTADERQEAEGKIKTYLTALSNAMVIETSEFQTELFLHDWLADRVTYNKAALSDGEKHKHAWDIMGAFIEGSAVCEGYTKAMQVLLNMTGVENTPVTGMSDEPHMWNMVKINGEWYHLDVTTNDTDDAGLHFYFNVNDETVLSARTLDPDFSTVADTELDTVTFNFRLPAATSVKNNYFVNGGSYVESLDQFPTVLSEGILRAVKSDKSFVEIGFAQNVGVGRMENIAKKLDLKGNLDRVNELLQPADRIGTYGWSTIDGASAIVISW